MKPKILQQLQRQISNYNKLLINIERESKAKISPVIIAIAGPPAVGKSTLAKKIVDDLNTNGYQAQYCPMDGFHMTNDELNKIQLKGLKGRIDTFQAIAFSKAIFSLKAKKSFWWPKFSRTQDNPIPHGSFISGKEDFFVIEGNYLFIQSEPWVSAAKNFQYSIFVDLPDKILRGRLYTRHQKGGFSMDLIKEKIENVDIPNAALIRETKSLANVIYIEDSNH